MIKHLDCTLRDGGYYNRWNFSDELVQSYLQAMIDIEVDYVEIGLRSKKNSGFRGAYAFCSDEYLEQLAIPSSIKIAVMVNAAELLEHPEGPEQAVRSLFQPKANSVVRLVRVACHINEVEAALPSVRSLKDMGYEVGLNLMQISECSTELVESLGRQISDYSVDALYFADSLGNMSPSNVSTIIKALRSHWKGEIGIHAHDNTGKAMANTLRAIEEGATWVDSTVTGMGRGPGNAQTEYLTLEIADLKEKSPRLLSLLKVINRHFKPLKEQYGWGANPYYYLSGKNSIHPTYVQEMLNDARYSEEDILCVIEHLKKNGGHKYNSRSLNSARHFYTGEPSGEWAPRSIIKDMDILVLGTGPGIDRHKKAIEQYIESHKPFVIALNAQKVIKESLINLRAACNPVRLLADCNSYQNFPQKFVIPLTMLAGDVQEALQSKNTYNFGLAVESGKFIFEETHCVAPNSLVISYVLAMASSGEAKRVYLAGFDGYGGDDPRNVEMNMTIELYERTSGAVELLAVTPTKYRMKEASIYGMI